jgi:hypothetical protein
MISGSLGLGGVLTLFADIWALVHVAQSNASPGGKAIWIALILLLPVLGFILWLLLGPRSVRG